MTSIYMSHKVVKKMDNSATSLFKSRLNTIQKKSVIIINLFLMAIFSIFINFIGSIYIRLWSMVATYT